MFMTSGYSAQTRSSGTEHRHLAADVVVGRRDRAARAGGEPERGRLALELGRGEPVEGDAVLRDLVRAVGADALAQSLEDERRALVADRHRTAGVDDAVDLAQVRDGDVDLLVVDVDLVGDRARQ